jgi:hypothetical protein
VSVTESGGNVREGMGPPTPMSGIGFEETMPDIGFSSG